LLITTSCDTTTISRGTEQSFARAGPGYGGSKMDLWNTSTATRQFIKSLKSQKNV
jgi:hypothetical protein